LEFRVPADDNELDDNMFLDESEKATEGVGVVE
jgi:hypothetical protein